MSDPAEIGRTLSADEEVDQSSDAAQSGRMTFLEHLDELRRRIIYSLYAFLAAFAVTLYYWKELWVFLTTYFGRMGGQLVMTKPMAGFMFSMKVSALAAVLVASPFVFTQLWLFVAPGLYAKEKRVVIPFVFFSSLLFCAGAAFAHITGFPAMWGFFASYDALGGVKFFPTLDDTFAFYVKTILGLGLAFQLPMLVYFLARFGVVTWKFLAKQFRYAMLIIVIAAAVVTPSGDPVTLMVFSVPMVVLYAVSIAVAWIFGKPKKE
jgi:sec-independent protein translocase protein TatC